MRKQIASTRTRRENNNSQNSTYIKITGRNCMCTDEVCHTCPITYVKLIFKLYIFFNIISKNKTGYMCMTDSNNVSIEAQKLWGKKKKMYPILHNSPSNKIKIEIDAKTEATINLSF